MSYFENFLIYGKHLNTGYDMTDYIFNDIHGSSGENIFALPLFANRNEYQ